MNLISKKFGVIDKKMEAMGRSTDEFHEATDKLENLYLKDIENRKKHMHDASGVSEES